MKPKTTKIVYWAATLFFALMMLMDGIGGVTQQAEGQEVLKHLGYPMYALLIFGVAKLLGVIAIVQTKFQTIKEWAYAGFAFTFLGASASRALAGDSGLEIFFPFIALGIMCIPYYFWKKTAQLI